MYVCIYMYHMNQYLFNQYVLANKDRHILYVYDVIVEVLLLRMGGRLLQSLRQPAGA